MDVVEQLVDGRRAYEQRAWATAYERLSAVDPRTLEDADCLALSTAAFLAGDREASARALQESYRRHTEAGALLAAARDTFWLGLLYNTSGNVMVGNGWAARGARLLQDVDPDAAEHGYLWVHQMYGHIFTGEFLAAHELAVRIAETGRRCHDANLVSVGLSCEGRLLIYLGQVREGLALLDEAMVGLADPDVSPILAGHSYCSMVEACQEIADYRRMAEWTTALTEWCRMQPEMVPFTGQCAVHRAQIMRSQGALPEALEELALAITRYAAEGATPAAGLALYERGEVLRIQGDLAGAAAAFQEAAALGRDPQPGQSLLSLAKGNGAAAAASMRRLLEETQERVQRTAQLPAAVEVLLAVDDVAAARAAADELARAGPASSAVRRWRRRVSMPWGRSSWRLATPVTRVRSVGRQRRCRTCGTRGSCGSTSARGTRPRGRGCGSGWRAGLSATRTRRRPSWGWPGGPSPTSARSRPARRSSGCWGATCRTG